MNTAQDNTPDNPDTRHNRDGDARVIVSEDGMRVDVMLYHALGKGKPIDLAYIDELLRREGIVHGVKYSVLEEAVGRANLEGENLCAEKIAEGSRAIKAVPPYIKLKKRFFAVAQGGLTEGARDDGSVDHRDRHSYVLVGKHELIGRLDHGRNGKKGTDVFGNEIPFEEETVIRFAVGENIRTEGDNLLAMTQGKLVIENQTVSVKEVMVIDGNVDYHTGHIRFPGDVIIEGTVKDGFIIQSGGSLTVKETLDASDIAVKKDMILEKGIKGRKTHKIRVGGSVSALFMDSISVEARGLVKVEKGIYMSEITTLERLETGEKGSIRGGIVQARKGITTGSAGNSHNLSTRLRCGIDFVVERKIAELRRKYDEIISRLNTLDLQRGTGGNSQLERFRQRLQDSILSLTEHMHALEKQLYPDRDAVIIVTGRIYPGVVLDIGGASQTIVTPHKHVRFECDPTHRVIRRIDL